MCWKIKREYLGELYNSKKIIQAEYERIDYQSFGWILYKI